MPHNEQRKETRHIPSYGMIAVCDSVPMFIGVVLDISTTGITLKSYKKPSKTIRHRNIRLMGPKGIKVENIPMEIVSISKKGPKTANCKRQNDHYHRIGIRLKPESEQAEQINQMINVIR